MVARIERHSPGIVLRDDARAIVLNHLDLVDVEDVSNLCTDLLPIVLIADIETQKDSAAIVHLQNAGVQAAEVVEIVAQDAPGGAIRSVVGQCPRTVARTHRDRRAVVYDIKIRRNVNALQFPAENTHICWKPRMQRIRIIQNPECLIDVYGRRIDDLPLPAWKGAALHLYIGPLCPDFLDGKRISSPFWLKENAISGIEEHPLAVDEYLRSDMAALKRDIRPTHVSGLEAGVLQQALEQRRAPATRAVEGTLQVVHVVRLNSSHAESVP